MKTRVLAIVIVSVAAVFLFARIARRKPAEEPSAAPPAPPSALSLAQAHFGTNRGIFRVNPADVSHVTIAGPGRAQLDLRAAGSGLFTMDGLATNEVVDAAAVNRFAGALEALSFASLADPARPAKDLGLEAPDRFTIKTQDGFYYSVLLGAPDGTNGRFARVRVEYQATVRPTGALDSKDLALRMEAYEKRIADDAVKAREMDAGVQPWTYVLSPAVCSDMTATREQLIRQVEPPAPPPAQAEGEEPEGEEAVAPDAE